MKKTLAFLLVLILASGSLTVLCGAEINRMSSDVSYRLLEEKGDRAYLEGIKIGTNLHHDRILLWENIFDPSGDTETEISFKKTGLPYRESKEFPGLDFLWYNSDFLMFENEEFAEKIQKAKEELSEISEEITFEFRMADYYDYYPVYFMLNLPDFYINTAPRDGMVGKQPFYYESIDQDRAEGFNKKLGSFIKIPVLTDDVRKITVESNFVKNSLVKYSYFTNVNDTFELTAFNAVFSDKCYFSFSNRTQGEANKEGKFVDTSLIPGGYGIYAFSYSANDVNYEEMKNVYPLPADSTVVSLHGDEENSLLYLYLWENGKYIFKVIDENTMTDISEVELFDYSGASDWVYTFTAKDFSLFVKNDFEIKVVERKPDGTYEVRLEYNMPQENEYNWTSFPFGSDYVFDGEKLIVAVPERSIYSDDENQRSCLLELFIFGNKEILYYGKWDCSLSESTDFYSAFCEYLDWQEIIIYQDDTR